MSPFEINPILPNAMKYKAFNIRQIPEGLNPQAFIILSDSNYLSDIPNEYFIKDGTSDSLITYDDLRDHFLLNSSEIHFSDVQIKDGLEWLKEKVEQR